MEQWSTPWVIRLGLIAAMGAYEPVSAREKPEFITLLDAIYSQQAEEISYEELYENLWEFYQHPLELNHASREDLSLLCILTDAQLDHFFDHLEKNGPLRSIHDLQAIPDFDRDTISQLVPFVQVSETYPKPTKALGKPGSPGSQHSYWLGGYERTIEQAKNSKTEEAIQADTKNAKTENKPKKQAADSQSKQKPEKQAKNSQAKQKPKKQAPDSQAKQKPEKQAADSQAKQKPKKQAADSQSKQKPEKQAKPTPSPSKNLKSKQGTPSPRKNLKSKQGTPSPRKNLKSKQGTPSPRKNLKSKQGTPSPSKNLKSKQGTPSPRKNLLLVRQIKLLHASYTGIHKAGT